MSYAVVEFIEESSVEVVSQEWIEIFDKVRSDWQIRLYESFCFTVSIVVGSHLHGLIVFVLNWVYDLLRRWKNLTNKIGRNIPLEFLHIQVYILHIRWVHLHQECLLCSINVQNCKK